MVAPPGRETFARTSGDIQNQPPCLFGLHAVVKRPGGSIGTTEDVIMPKSRVVCVCSDGFFSRKFGPRPLRLLGTGLRGRSDAVMATTTVHSDRFPRPRQWIPKGRASWMIRRL